MSATAAVRNQPTRRKLGADLSYGLLLSIQSVFRGKKEAFHSHHEVCSLYNEKRRVGQCAKTHRAFLQILPVSALHEAVH